MRSLCRGGNRRRPVPGSEYSGDGVVAQGVQVPRPTVGSSARSGASSGSTSPERMRSMPCTRVRSSRSPRSPSSAGSRPLRRAARAVASALAMAPIGSSVATTRAAASAGWRHLRGRLGYRGGRQSDHRERGRWPPAHRACLGSTGSEGAGHLCRAIQPTARRLAP